MKTSTVRFLLLLVGFLASLQFSSATESFGVAPTDGVLSLNFLFTGQGCDASKAWCYNLVNNTGTLTVRGKQYQAVAYYTQLWPSVLRWIDILGVAEDGSDLSIFYLDYKYWENHVVTPIWEEDWTHTLTSSTITRAPATFVDRTDNEVNIDVKLPALNALPQATYDTQITIHRTDEISFSRTTGWVIIDGANYTTTPISTVNCDGCPKNCPECTPSPWYEIHMALSSSEINSYCFGIYYIYPKNPSFVQLNYTLCLPQLTMPAETFEAKWSGTIPDDAHVYVASQETRDSVDRDKETFSQEEKASREPSLQTRLNRRVRRETEDEAISVVDQ